MSDNYGLFRPRLLPMLLQARQDQQAEAPQVLSPEEAAYYGYFGAVAHPNAAQAAYQHRQAVIARNQALYSAQMQPVPVPVAVDPSAALSGDFGAEGWDEDEDEDEFGAAADAEDDEIAEEVAYGSNGRLHRKKDRLNRKQSKWERRAQSARTQRGRDRATRKVGKFTEREDKLDAKIDRKTARRGGGQPVGGVVAVGGGGGGEGSSMFYQHNNAPPMRGNLLLLPMIPKATPSGIHTGSTSIPRVKTVLTADGLGTEIVMTSPDVSWAECRIVGFRVNMAASRSDGAELFVKNLKCKGHSELFLADDWQSADPYDIKYVREPLGLRAQPVLKSPNKAEVTCAVYGDNTDRLDWGVFLIVDVTSDVMASSGGDGYRQAPGPYVNG